MGDNYIFTFGVGHELAKYYVELCGDISSTREEMFRLFGPHWAFQYDKKKGDELVKEYNYIPLKVDSPVSFHQ